MKQRNTKETAPLSPDWHWSQDYPQRDESAEIEALNAQLNAATWTAPTLSAKAFAEVL